MRGYDYCLIIAKIITQFIMVRKYLNSALTVLASVVLIEHA